MWVPDDGSKAFAISSPINIEPEQPASSQPATIPTEVHPVDVNTATPAPATQTTAAIAPATAPATQESAAATQNQDLKDLNLPPGHEITQIIDPNQTTRYVYNASYDNIWQQTMLLVARTGFIIDRKDYRQGVITTRSLPSAQFVEFWKPQQTNFNNAMENTINSQRRYLRVTINTVPGQPKFYEIGVQVLVEREVNPTGLLAGPLFIEGSGFGRNAMTLRSDYADATTATPITTVTSSKKTGTTEQQPDPNRRWVLLGHDPDLEKKLLNELFDRI